MDRTIAKIPPRPPPLSRSFLDDGDCESVVRRRSARNSGPKPPLSSPMTNEWIGITFQKNARVCRSAK